MPDCVFCKIAAGEIPCRQAYEDDSVLAFYDIHPQAPVHILIIPKAHIACGAAEVTEENSALVGRCFEAAARLAKELGVTGGFRIVTNNGPGAGQTVSHLHFHLLAGRELGLTMG
ncbi:MAG: histidine triad nucleotide-binding protein [Oscillospiraceae bacterium]|jgi:histidine triad (HIT) family protein|nr:histidine triad nucleotide-binding protein [Oscillospiraceae bacterium]